MPIHAWLQVQLDGLTADILAMFKKTIAHLPYVISCYQVAGDIDFLVEIVAQNLTALQDILTNHLTKATAIRYIKTYIGLDTIKEGGIHIQA